MVVLNANDEGSGMDRSLRRRSGWVGELASAPKIVEMQLNVSYMIFDTALIVLKVTIRSWHLSILNGSRRKATDVDCVVRRISRCCRLHNMERDAAKG